MIWCRGFLNPFRFVVASGKVRWLKSNYQVQHKFPVHWSRCDTFIHSVSHSFMYLCYFPPLPTMPLLPNVSYLVKK